MDLTLKVCSDPVFHTNLNVKNSRAHFLTKINFKQCDKNKDHVRHRVNHFFINKKLYYLLLIDTIVLSLSLSPYYFAVSILLVFIDFVITREIFS